MRMKLVIVLALAVSALAITAWLSAPPSAAHVPYSFQHNIGDVVEYDNDWWEIIAVMEYRSKMDGNIYPWYKLSRPNAGITEELWVWAERIDFLNGVILMGGGDPEDCCPNPPPDCPKPPCAPEP
jgi:hypothetical protein